MTLSWNCSLLRSLTGFSLTTTQHAIAEGFFKGFTIKCKICKCSLLDAVHYNCIRNSLVNGQINVSYSESVRRISTLLDRTIHKVYWILVFYPIGLSVRTVPRNSALNIPTRQTLHATQVDHHAGSRCQAFPILPDISKGQ